LCNPAVPAKTVNELVDLIKANPGKYSFGSAGAGTQAHLAGEQFRLSLGLVASGQVAATPPRRAMNSRRLTGQTAGFENKNVSILQPDQAHRHKWARPIGCAIRAPASFRR
jgi:hypothetical protein